MAKLPIKPKALFDFLHRIYNNSLDNPDHWLYVVDEDDRDFYDIYNKSSHEDMLMVVTHLLRTAHLLKEWNSRELEMAREIFVRCAIKKLSTGEVITYIDFEYGRQVERFWENISSYKGYINKMSHVSSS